MAPAQIEAVCAVRDIRQIRVYSPRRAASFVEGMIGQYPQIRAVSSVDEALDGADIVVTSTDSDTPFVLREHLTPGMHLNAIGAYTPLMAEIAPEVVAAAKVVVDQREAAWAEAGDLIQAKAAGLITDVYAEIGEIASGATPGRADAAEITLFKSVGVGAQDLFAARAALENASRLGLGVEVAF